MNQTIAPLFDCDFLLNTMPREKKILSCRFSVRTALRPSRVWSQQMRVLLGCMRVIPLPVTRGSLGLLM